MSGGSYDYAYYKVDEFASALRTEGPQGALREAFRQHLRLVSKAMHAVEWVDSCDWAEGGEVEDIKAVLKEGAELEVCISRAQDVLDELSSAIQLAREACPGPTADPGVE